MASITVENYLKRIYLEQQQAPESLVPMGRLAGAMGVVETATTMIKALANSGLVNYEPRGGVRLTRGGERLALHVLRRHRVVELFLVKVLGLDWSEVHAEAEELEHAISEKVLRRIDQVLGHPRTDPHGDPIPPADGKLPDVRFKSLAEAKPGQRLRVARVMDQGPAFLQFIERCGLTPGAAVTIGQRDDLAQTLLLRLRGRRPLTLALAAGQKVLVEAG